MDVFKILSNKTLFCIEYRLPVGSPVPIQNKQEPWIPAILAVGHSSGVTSQEHSFKGALIRRSGNYCFTLMSEPRFYVKFLFVYTSVKGVFIFVSSCIFSLIP